MCITRLLLDPQACYFHFFATPSRYPSHKMGRMVGYGNLFIALLGDGPPYLLSAYVQHADFPDTIAARYAPPKLYILVYPPFCVCISLIAYTTTSSPPTCSTRTSQTQSQRGARHLSNIYPSIPFFRLTRYIHMYVFIYYMYIYIYIYMCVCVCVCVIVFNPI